MSSLLDILNRKDGRPEAEAPDAEPVMDAAAPAVELRLAVDNGPPDPAENADSQLSIAPDPVAATPPQADPFATFVGSLGKADGGTDAARVVTPTDLQRRSRRNTAVLGAGLGLILLAAGAATWLLNEVSTDSVDDSSLFVTPGPATAWEATPAPEGPAGIVARPAAATSTAKPAPAAKIARAPVPARAPSPAPARTEPDAGLTAPGSDDFADTEWFNTPASEEPLGGSGAANYEPVRIVRGTTTNPLFPKLNEAWTAFQAGDYARAETLYRDVRSADANNADALLGLAALAVRGGRADEARDLYQAVVLLEPTNAAAISALSTMPATGTRVLDESTLKSLLREQPGAADLHFALGLKYVAQTRWPDAQSAFFEAVRNDPANADYAYNLAVSLDQLGQKGPAAAYYQRALDLATASALFDPGAAEARLTALRAIAP